MSKKTIVKERMYRTPLGIVLPVIACLGVVLASVIVIIDIFTLLPTLLMFYIFCIVYAHDPGLNNIIWWILTENEK